MLWLPRKVTGISQSVYARNCLQTVRCSFSQPLMTKRSWILLKVLFPIQRYVSNSAYFWFPACLFCENCSCFHLKVLRLRREEESLDNIGQYWVDCPSQESKYKAIDNIYSVITIGQAIIFCQTKKTAAWLSSKLKKDGHAVSLLSGDLTIEERIQVHSLRNNCHRPPHSASW